MVLVEGEYTIEETVRVLAMGHPPSEKRNIARSVDPRLYETVYADLPAVIEHCTVTSIFSVPAHCRSKRRPADFFDFIRCLTGL